MSKHGGIGLGCLDGWSMYHCVPKFIMRYTTESSRQTGIHPHPPAINRPESPPPAKRDILLSWTRVS